MPTRPTAAPTTAGETWKAPHEAVKATGEAANDALIAARPDLATLPAALAARSMGVTTNAVNSYRRRHFPDAPVVYEVSAVTVTSGSSGKPNVARPRRPSKLDAFRDLIGVLSDAEVGRRAALTREAVRLYRKARGIAAGSPRRGRREVTTPPVAPVPPQLAPANTLRAVSSHAWRIRLARHDGAEVELFAVAATAGDVCALAGTVGEVLSADRIGMALTASHPR
jgi:hypothetical protein